MADAFDSGFSSGFARSFSQLPQAILLGLQAGQKKKEFEEEKKINKLKAQLLQLEADKKAKQQKAQEAVGAQLFGPMQETEGSLDAPVGQRGEAPANTPKVPQGELRRNLLEMGQPKLAIGGLLDTEKQAEPFTLSPGQTRFGPGGKPIASVPKQSKAPTPQSKVGKLLFDRQMFINSFGEGSKQVRAFDELTTAEQKGEAPKLSDERGIRQEFTKASGDFVKVRDAFSKVQSSTVDPSAAGDLAMIFNFMKMLDPGSVVREGEFATAQSAAGVPTQIRNIYNRVLSGERLAPEQRQDFLTQARRIFDSTLQSQVQLEQEFGRIAKQSGIDPRKVVVDFVGRQRNQPKAAPKQSTSAMPKNSKLIGRTQEGKKVFRTPDGQLLVED